MKIGTVFKILIPIAIAASIGFYIFSQSIPSATVMAASRGIAVNAVPGTVVVLAEKEMLIRGEYGGRVTASNLIKGGTVSENEVLIELDTGDIDLQIEKAEIDLKQAKRNIEIRSPFQHLLDTSKETLTDMEFRLEKGGVRELDVTKARRAVEKIEDDIAREELKNDSALQTLENTVKRLKRQREKMVIISPIDGTVTDVFAHKGDLIGSAATLAKVVSKTRIVEVKVSEEHFEGLEIGMPARVVFLGIESDPFYAKIEQIIPGLTGDATITIDENQDAIQVPRQAVVNDRILLVENGIVVEKEIQTGYTSITMIEVIEGVSEGDTVIVEDIHLYEDGDRVKPVMKQ